jgi:hypothetical protein
MTLITPAPETLQIILSILQNASERMRRGLGDPIHPRD